MMFFDSVSFRNSDRKDFTMEINWGIAAAGRITHDFVTAIDTIENNYHKVVAVADPNLARAREFAFKHGIKTYYGSFEEFAKDPEIDIVYVGTINPFHFKVAKLMLESGKNVLCEKPICLNYDDAKILYDLAKEKSVFLMEAMWSRCFPSYAYLNRIISQGSIGEVREIHVSHGFRALEVERIRAKQLGGGITLDIGIYTVQLAQMLFKRFPEKITAIGTIKDGVDVESSLTLEYEGGGKLYARISGLENLNNQALIRGTKGDIILENYWCCTKLIEPDGSSKEWPLPAGKFGFNHTNGCGLRYEAEEVRKCLEAGLKEYPLYTYENSLEMVKIEDEIRRQLGIQFNDLIKEW